MTLLAQHILSLRLVAELKNEIEISDTPSPDLLASYKAARADVDAQGPDVVMIVMKMLRRTFRRKGLTGFQPTDVINVDAKTWRKAAECLASECYIFIVERDNHGKLSDAAAETGDIDALAQNSVNLFVYEKQGRKNPLRQKVWKKLCKSIEQFVETGHVAQNTPKINKGTIIGRVGSTAPPMPQNELSQSIGTYEGLLVLIADLAKPVVSRHCSDRINDLVLYLLSDSSRRLRFGDFNDCLWPHVNEIQRGMSRSDAVISVVEEHDDGSEPSRSMIAIDLSGDPTTMAEIRDTLSRTVGATANGDPTTLLMLNSLTDTLLRDGKVSQKEVATRIRELHPEIPTERISPQRVSDIWRRFSNALKQSTT
jgi:hypothetical protein